jgi:hypothetical protein
LGLVAPANVVLIATVSQTNTLLPSVSHTQRLTRQKGFCVCRMYNRLLSKRKRLLVPQLPTIEADFYHVR